jgi:hypothetical protein
MPYHFPFLRLHLSAEPDKIYRNEMPPKPPVQPLKIKFTLEVTNGSRSDFHTEASGNPLHVKLSQNGKEITHAPQIDDPMMRELKIPATETAKFSVDLNVEDAHGLAVGTAQVEGMFTPTGDKTSIEIPVENAYCIFLQMIA